MGKKKSVLELSVSIGVGISALSLFAGCTHQLKGTRATASAPSTASTVVPPLSGGGSGILPGGGSGGSGGSDSSSSAQLTAIVLNQDSIVLKGSRLSGVTQLQVRDITGTTIGKLDKPVMQIDGSLKASALSTITLLAGQFYNLLITDANAAPISVPISLNSPLVTSTFAGTTPSTVMGTAQIDELKLTNSTGTATLDFGVFSGTTTQWIQSSTPASSSALQASALVLNPAGGKIGIGLDTPASVLHLTNSASTSASPVRSYFPYDLRVDSSGDSGLFFQTPATSSSGGNVVVTISQGTSYDGANAGMRMISNQSTGLRELQLFAVNGGSQVATSSGSKPGYQVGIGAQYVTINTSTSISSDLTVSGCVKANGSMIGGCASDQRLKTDIRPFQLGLDTVLGLRPQYFKYNGLGGEAKTDKDQLGLIAQEVEKVAPALVFEKKAKLHSEDQKLTSIKGVEYGALIYTVINAVQEFYHQFQQLKGQIKEESVGLRKEMESLKKENQQLKDYLCKKDKTAAFCVR